MRFEPTALPGVWVLHPEAAVDERGYFARTFCAEEFLMHGLDPHVAQSSVSSSTKPNTLRGLHLQRDPHGETKLIRCAAGAVFDVAVDLRHGSETFGVHHSVELSAANGLGLVVSPGVAHGFLTLAPATEVWYQMSVPYHPSAASGVRWDDADLAIAWPSGENPVISAADRALPGLAEWTSATRVDRAR